MTAVQANSTPTRYAHPTSTAHFDRLQGLGFTARVGTLDLEPTEALAYVVATTALGSFTAVRMTPRQGTPFVLVLEVRDDGLVTIAE